jgi:hypothetical protein
MLFARNPHIEPFERPQRDDRQRRRGSPECKLAPAKTKTDNRRCPKRCRRGHPGDEVASSQNRPASDETHACQNAKRQAHKIHDAERIGGLPADGKQDISLNHRNRCCEANQDRGPKASRMAPRTSVKADERGSDHCENEAKAEILPGGMEGHGHWRWRLGHAIFSQHNLAVNKNPKEL